MSASLPPVLGGRYRVVRLIGRGGAGEVHEVEHARTGEHLALKLLHSRALIGEAAIARFQREARVAARIKSEHVVRVIDADVAPELDGAPYLVMELLSGQDLAQACGDAPQPPERTLGWLRQLASALDKAHEAGVVHRDLKPENVFLARQPGGGVILKVLDFGLAKVTLGDLTASTASGEILGTPLFMAPEQADLNRERVTPRADLFALGLMAHKLLTGRHFWASRQLVPLVKEICILRMPKPSDRGCTLGPAFDAWFARACHRDPKARFDRATAQVEALAMALSVPDTARLSSVPPVAVERPPRSRDLRVHWLLIASVLVVASVTGEVTRERMAARSHAAASAGAAEDDRAASPPSASVTPSSVTVGPMASRIAVAAPPRADPSPSTAAVAKIPARALVQHVRPIRDPWADQK
jgi:serine/threonine protein kinase